MDFLDIENRFIKEVYEDEEYKKYIDLLDVPVLKKKKKQFETVVDLGCNIGMFSFWIRDRAEAIYSIDIDIEAIKVAKKLADKNLIDNISFEYLGVADHDGVAWLDVDRGAKPTHGGHRLVHIPQRTGKEIPIVSLKKFLYERRLNKVDLLKVDIEGGEEKLFAPSDFPVKKVKRIIGEYHRYNPVPRLIELGYKATDYPRVRHFIAERV